MLLLLLFAVVGNETLQTDECRQSEHGVGEHDDHDVDREKRRLQHRHELRAIKHAYDVKLLVGIAQQLL